MTPEGTDRPTVTGRAYARPMSGWTKLLIAILCAIGLLALFSMAVNQFDKMTAGAPTPTVPLVAVAVNTPVVIVDTATPIDTLVVPTDVPATATDVPPSATDVPPSATPAPPTDSPTPVPSATPGCTRRLTHPVFFHTHMTDGSIVDSPVRMSVYTNPADKASWSVHGVAYPNTWGMATGDGVLNGRENTNISLHGLHASYFCVTAAPNDLSGSQIRFDIWAPSDASDPTSFIFQPLINFRTMIVPVKGVDSVMVSPQSNGSPSMVLIRDFSVG